MGESTTTPATRPVTEAHPTATPRRSALELGSELREVQFVRRMLYVSVVVTLGILALLVFGVDEPGTASALTLGALVGLAIPAGLVLLGLQILDRHGAWVVGTLALWLTALVAVRLAQSDEAVSWTSLIFPAAWILTLWGTTLPAAHLSRQVRESPDGFVAQWLAGRDGEGLGPHQREALARRRWVYRAELALRAGLAAVLVVLAVLGAQRLV